jgi:hypothetical protein
MEIEDILVFFFFFFFLNFVFSQRTIQFFLEYYNDLNLHFLKCSYTINCVIYDQSSSNLNIFI